MLLVVRPMPKSVPQKRASLVCWRAATYKHQALEESKIYYKNENEENRALMKVVSCARFTSERWNTI